MFIRESYMTNHARISYPKIFKPFKSPQLKNQHNLTTNKIHVFPLKQVMEASNPDNTQAIICHIVQIIDTYLSPDGF